MSTATATATLRKEHDAILRMLDATEEVARQLERGEHVALDTLTGLLEFFRLFADRCHHGKEEDILFPLLEQKGLARFGGPIGVMLNEHDLGRSLIQVMSVAAGDYGRSSPEAGRQWAEAAQSYVTMLRLHIAKENNVLFRIAEDLLSEAEQRELALAFEKLEEQKMGAGTHERLHTLMDQLTENILSR